MVDQSSDALEHALRLLGPRPRSERELSDRLRSSGHDTDAIDDAIDRARQLGLVDDAAFARQWVEERSQRKGSGPHKLKAELGAKGIPPELIEEAIGTLDDEGQLACATTIAQKQAAKVVDLPLTVQAARIHAALARRGFDEEIANDAVRAVLPPEGWD